MIFTVVSFTSLVFAALTTSPNAIPGTAPNATPVTLPNATPSPLSIDKLDLSTVYGYLSDKEWKTLGLTRRQKFKSQIFDLYHHSNITLGIYKDPFSFEKALGCRYKDLTPMPPKFNTQHECIQSMMALRSVFQKPPFTPPQMIELETRDRTTPYPTLLEAVHADDYNGVVILIASGQDINRLDESGNTPLHIATLLKRGHSVMALIQANVDVNIPDSNGCTALCLAIVSEPDLDIIEALIKAGADINHQENESGMTPISKATEVDFELLRVLINAGANVNTPDIDGCSPLCSATVYGDLEMVEALVNVHADLNQWEKFHQTPLLLAVSNSFLEIVEVLVQSGADVNICDVYGTCPLYMAASLNDIEIVQILLRANADLDVENNEGMSAVDIAMSREYYDVVHLIQKRKIKNQLNQHLHLVV